MSHYSESPNMCRVDFWKESGKWYTTEAVEFGPQGFDGDAPLIHDCFREYLIKHFGKPRLVGMRATCLEPYHKNSHPISLVIKEDWFV